MFDMPEKKNAVSVIAYRHMGEGLYDVCALVSSDSRDDVATAFRESVGNRMAMVNGTYRRVESQTDVRCRFVARETKQFKSYNDTASMTALGNGEFIDTAENIWNVIQDGKDRHLVLKSTDDLADLLDQIKKRNGVAVAGNDLAGEVYMQTGDFAAMVKDDGTLAYGVVGYSRINNELVRCLLNPVSQEVVKVDNARVVDAIFDVEVNKNPDVATLQSGDMKKIWDYLSKIYPPEFISKYKAQVGA
jgi:hypothetical protein